MYDTILIPFDGSDEARKGAEHGVELAAALGTSVHVLYVIDLPGTPRSLSIRDDEEEMRQEYREYGEEVTNEVCEEAAKVGVDCTAVLRTGAPAEEIVEYADVHDVDAIVVGSAYRGQFRALLGGTFDKVVRTATVPVITTRMTIDEQ